MHFLFCFVVVLENMYLIHTARTSNYGMELQKVKEYGRH